MLRIFSNYDISAIIHFAAYKCVGESVSNPLLYYENNVVGLINILKLANKFNIKNMVFSSSCTVYGQPDVLPVTENTPLQIANCPYGNTKQICEEIIKDYAIAHNNFNAILLRYFNPIGAHPSGFIGESPIDVPQNLLPYLMQTAIGIRECLSVYGNDHDTEDGYCVRDYIDVVDLAKAHIVALERLLQNNNIDNTEIYNLGTGKGLSVLDIINIFEEVTCIKLNYKIVDRRPGDVEQIYCSPEKANEILGWKSTTPIHETILNAWKWEQNMQNI
jgi:UDP-glucose 4-epimerase